MAREIPTTEPLEVIKGTTVKYDLDLADFPTSEGWTVTVNFGGDGTIADATATIVDGKYRITIAATVTADWTIGDYWYQTRATLDGEVYNIPAHAGTFQVKADLSAIDSHDGRSHAKKMIDVLEAVLQGKASKDQLSYTIGDVQIVRLSPESLQNWLDRYRSEYAIEKEAARAAQGKPSQSTIHTTFAKW